MWHQHQKQQGQPSLCHVQAHLESARLYHSNKDQDIQEQSSQCATVWCRVLENNLSHWTQVGCVSKQVPEEDSHDSFWPNMISNNKLHRRTETAPMYKTCLPHALQVFAQNRPMMDPMGKLNRGRPKETWHSTVKRDLKIRGLNLESASNTETDRDKRRSLVIAWSTRWHKED